MDNQAITYLERLEKKIDSLTELLKERSDLSNKWLRTNEVCEYLSISSSQLQVYKNEGYFSVRKLGGTNYYDREEIDEVIENLIE